jgi:DNA repair photolyase
MSRVAKSKNSQNNGLANLGQMPLRLLTVAEKSQMSPALVDPVEYRKSGLSLNHVVGCPLDCSYCVRHLFHNFEMKQPRLLMNDDEAVEYLVQHRFFQPHVTPLQLFNRATDPFLLAVKPHTFSVAESLSRKGLTNHLLIITRFKVTKEDCERLNEIRNLKVTLLITYSGITDKRVEPIDSEIAAESIKLSFASAKSYRTIFYWRPVVPFLNDSDEHLARAVELSHHAHATVFTGLFYRKEMAEFFRERGIPEPYNDVARRKIMPKTLDSRIVNAFQQAKRLGILFRKTSCGVAFAHGLPDYNGHYGIRELCDICPTNQQELCRSAWVKPEFQKVARLSGELGATDVPEVGDGAILTEGLDEPRRYFIQHTLGYQVHDRKYPHIIFRHGRANIGWDTEPHNPNEHNFNGH